MIREALEISIDCKDVGITLSSAWAPVIRLMCANKGHGGILSYQDGDFGGFLEPLSLFKG